MEPTEFDIFLDFHLIRTVNMNKSTEYMSSFFGHDSQLIILQSCTVPDSRRRRVFRPL